LERRLALTLHPRHLEKEAQIKKKKLLEFAFRILFCVDSEQVDVFAHGWR
jgi:hypothetical protein